MAKIRLTTPVCRLVSGSTAEPQTKDHKGAPLTVKSGPNMGQPMQRWFLAVAIAKNDPAWPALRATIAEAARAGFPQLIDAQGNALRRDFAWKIDDGDSTELNQSNKRNCDKEGYPGHWVLRFSSGFKPDFFVLRDGAYYQLDGAQIKRGDYIRISGNVEANGDAQKPGVYLNVGSVLLDHAGDAIASGPTPEQLFGSAPAAPAAPAPQGTFTAPAGSIAPPMAPAAMAPAADFLRPAHVGLPPLPPPPAAVDPVGPAKYSYNGQLYAKAELMVAGWTEAQIEALPRA